MLIFTSCDTCNGGCWVVTMYSSWALIGSSNEESGIATLQVKLSTTIEGPPCICDEFSTLPNKTGVLSTFGVSVLNNVYGYEYLRVVL